MSWQRVIVLELDGELYGLDLDETRAVVHWLRTPNSDVPAADPGSTAAAVFYERLLEEPKAQNPPMNDEESRGILLALARMVVEEGLTEPQSALHEALLAHFAGYVTLGLLAEPKPLADLRREAAYEATLRPSVSRTSGSARGRHLLVKSHGHKRPLTSLNSLA